MTLNLKESFERWCRLCAKEQEVTIKIFSTEAEALLLHDKLNKYLLLEIDRDDKLPKNICIQCCTKLQTVCEFIDNVKNAQETLINHCMVLKSLEKGDWLPPEISAEPVTELKPSECIKDSSMEISLDPMIILQNSDNILLPSVDENLKNNAEDVIYVNGVDGENVTIKLIKKSNTGLEITNDNLVLKPLQCTTCQKEFDSVLDLKIHSQICVQSIVQDTAQKKYNCNICHERFYFKCDLISHFKQHRTTGICQVCGRNFRSEKNLSLHMAGHMSKGILYTCKVCHRSYSNPSNLKTHSITHSNDRPYKCHLCKKTFKRNQDLKFHINQHTGAKPYKCPFCDKTFASSGNCYSHRSRMHPEKQMKRKEKAILSYMQDNQSTRSRGKVASKNSATAVKGAIKYQCHLCEHSFMKRDNFMYHMYQHTGKKPFPCSFCNEGFFTRKGLLIHCEKEHPGRDRPLAMLSKNALLK